MNTTLRFGCAELHPQTRQVSIAGESLKLGGRAFDVLATLIIKRYSVLSAQDLLDLVWPGLIVEQSNVQVQVSNLRRLLGAQTILTVPRRGYQFGMEVEEQLKASSNSANDLFAGMPLWLANHWRRDPRLLTTALRSLETT